MTRKLNLSYHRLCLAPVFFSSSSSSLSFSLIPTSKGLLYPKYPRILEQEMGLGFFLGRPEICDLFV